LDSIASIIKNADNRIKTVYVDSLDYDTYAVVYKNIKDATNTVIGGQYYEVLISEDDDIEFGCIYSASPFETKNY